jgi:bifunctional DNA-binding transcriptional regulator/antitoxin component of YhaV-PrlF toxin-antitoxin module
LKWRIDRESFSNSVKKLELETNFQLSYLWAPVIDLRPNSGKGTIMPSVRVRDKHQITLPVSVVQAAALAPNDVLDVEYTNGVITLVPTARVPKRASANAFLGALKGTWGKSAAAINRELRADRDSWDR